jgi:hypothetical protein
MDVAAPVAYAYFVKALGEIGDPRAIQPLTSLRSEVEFQSGLPHMFADLVMPRYQYLRLAIDAALVACRVSHGAESRKPGRTSLESARSPVTSIAPQPSAPVTRFAPCPQCGSTDVKKVRYTLWGGLLMPLLLHQVKCNACGKTYNGKTGR